MLLVWTEYVTLPNERLTKTQQTTIFSSKQVSANIEAVAAVGY